MMKSLKIFVAITIIILTGCSKSLDYQYTSQKNQLIMYSFPITDSILSIHISKSVNIVSNSNFDNIENATIDVIINNEVVSHNKYPSHATWFNINNIELKDNDAIKLLCTTEEGVEFYGETTIPQTVPIIIADSIDNTDDSFTVMNANTLNCLVEFNDPPRVRNYYQLRVDLQTTVDNKTTYKTLDYNKDDKVFLYFENENDLLVDVDYQGTFNDNLINGLNYTLELSIPRDSIKIDNNTSAQLNFYLYSLSADYYDYYRTSIAEDSYRENIFYKTQNIFSNIEGGVGLVGGLSVSTYSLPLKQVIQE